MLEIRQLQVFLAVWENRSFSLAANEIHLTQPTVSGHIRVLEETLGVRLFDR
ncbi:MAG: LysR family transcriptional regulator, partial [Thermodesulfobacteriota bacterium]|nr:LysR family transcriptional regulator [Thermodesulfobacteriota bacterium]